MKIRWVRSALRDLNEICDYIAADNPAAAERTGDQIQSAVALLEEHPHAGREGRVPETRELAVAGTPYLVAYSVTAKRMAIVGVIHAARRWPDQFGSLEQ